MPSFVDKIIEIHEKFPKLTGLITINDCKGDIFGFMLHASDDLDLLLSLVSNNGYRELLEYPDIKDHLILDFKPYVSDCDDEVLKMLGF